MDEQETEPATTPEVEAQIEAGRAFMREYHEVFAALAA